MGLSCEATINGYKCRGVGTDSTTLSKHDMVAEDFITRCKAVVALPGFEKAKVLRLFLYVAFLKRWNIKNEKGKKINRHNRA